MLRDRLGFGALCLLALLDLIWILSLIDFAPSQPADTDSSGLTVSPTSSTLEKDAQSE